jgi:RNA polymerase sigma factor (sigma-70 family)
MEHEPHDRDYTLFLESQLRRVDGIVRRLCRRLGWTPTREVAEDSRQVAGYLLWRLRGRIEPLPDAERQPYTYRCMLHAVWAVLRREMRQQSQEISADELKIEARQAIEHADDRGWEALFSDDIRQQVSNPSLAAALQTLSPEELLLLNLHYCLGLTDRAAGERLGISEDAARVRRNRVLARLRRMLQSE